MPLKGNDILIYLGLPGEPYPKMIGCDKGLTLNIENDFYAISDLTPDAFSLIPTFTNYTIESDTLYITGTGDKNGTSELAEWANEKTKLFFYFTIEGTTYSGEVFIQGFSIAANYEEVVQANITFKGNGKLIIS